MKMNKQVRIGIILFLIPAMLLFVTFFVFPIGYVAVMSLFSWNGMTTPQWNNFGNYLAIFEDKYFWLSLRNNVIWAIAAVLIQVPLALLMALILSQKVKGWKIFRTIYFLPQVISGIAIASMWSAIYNSEYGLLNGILHLVGLDSLATNWLGNTATAFPCVLGYGLFYVGYYMVILMSGISSVDESYYEAAKIDGANRFQVAFHVTIPMIKYSLMTATTLAAVFGLRTFEQVYLLTNGGPAHRTSVLVLYLYNQMRDNDYGGANASSIMLILTGAVVIMSIRMFFEWKEKKEEKQGKKTERQVENDRE